MDENQEKIVVVADSSTCTGFRLAGVQDVFRLEGKAAEKKLDELLTESNAGIIIITEKLLASMDHRLKKKVEKTAKPVVVAVPDKSGPSEEVESVKDLIKRALGFELIK